jgi:ATP-dependent Zn protease
MRGGSLGHHQTFDREERFSRWQSEDLASLIHTVGAMAAEHVFYNENSRGVGGDLQMATQRAAIMAGQWGMAPARFDIPDGMRFDDESAEETRKRIAQRFEHIGLRLMNRTRGGADFQGDPVAAVLTDPFKRAIAAQFLGQAFAIAYVFIRHNREAVDRIAQAVLDKQEIYGNDLNQLLDSVGLQEPSIDWTEEDNWPKV